MSDLTIAPTLPINSNNTVGVLKPSESEIESKRLTSDQIRAINDQRRENAIKLAQADLKVLTDDSDSDDGKVQINTCARKRVKKWSKN